MAELLNPSEIFATAFEPKVKNRFILYVDGLPSFIIKKVNRPKLTQARKELDHMNTKSYYKGKSVWDEITMELYDPIVPSGAQAAMEWIRLHHESATGRDGYSSFYKKLIRINQLSPLGEVIEEWILNGAFITESNFGSLDWGSEEVVNIEMTLRYDWAFLNF
jgi:hypothetical protein